MTAEQKAKFLVGQFKGEIGCSDFHVPEFISGTPCADGSDAYIKVYEEEELMLAKKCATICVDQILSIEGNYLIEKDFWNGVKEEITKL